MATWPKTTIQSATRPVGVMPPMQPLLTMREMRDLAAFLATLRQAE